MARRTCSKCNTSNSDDALFCRHCGEKLLFQNHQSANNASNWNEKGCLMVGFLSVLGPFAAFVFILGGICALLGGEVVAGSVMIIIGSFIVVIINKYDTD